MTYRWTKRTAAVDSFVLEPEENKFLDNSHAAQIFIYLFIAHKI